MSTLVDMSRKTVYKRVHRFDRNRISSNISRTPQGFLKIPATITRTGLLKYRLPDGREWVELRTPEEVHRADSLATLEDAPVTEDHRGMITPENIEEHGAGYVTAKVSHTDTTVNAGLIIQRQKTIDGVLSGDLIEVSAGYSADMDITPGDFEGEHYDAVQRNIRYNHVALGPKDWARGGNEMTLHLDSKDEHGIGVEVSTNDGSTGKALVNNTNQEKRGIEMKKLTFRFDGISFTIEVPEALADAYQSSIDKMVKEHADSKAGLDTVRGELAAAQKSVETLKGELASAQDPKIIDAAVVARAALVQDCKKLFPEIDISAKTPRQLQVEALEHAGAKTDHFDGQSDGYVEGFFRAEASKISEPAAPGARSVGVFPGPKTHEDSQGAPPPGADTPEMARQKMIEKSDNLWLPKA